MDEKLHVRKICPGVFLLDENRKATGYLVVGRDRACVIDTMMAATDLGGEAAMHHFKVVPGRHYQQNHHVIVYDTKKL